MAKRVQLRSVQELIKHARPQITQLVSDAEKSADKRKSAVIDAAKMDMLQSQGIEIDRLVALSEVNPNIRKDEITYLQTSRDQLEEYLQSATLKLDAIRVAMAT